MKKDKDKKENKVNPEEEKAVKKAKKDKTEEEIKKVKKPAKNKDVVDGFNKNDLNSELERLAEIFREELKNQGELEEEVLRDSQGIIYEDEVCECCGERRKAKNSDYCKPCQEAMRKYPLSIPMMLAAVVVIVFAVFSVIDFSKCFDGYYAARKAKLAVADKKMYTAIEQYDESINIFSQAGINAKTLKFEKVDIMYNVMMASEDILTTLEGALDQNEAKLPIYDDRVKQYDELYVLNKTMEKMFDIYDDDAYAKAGEDEAVYNEAMTAIGSLIDLEIVVPSLDGESRIYKGNEAAVRYCQYTYAYIMGNSEDVYYYVYEVYKLAPHYLCMYGYDLGMVSAQTRDFKTALEAADALYKNNVEDSTAYCIYSVVERLRGNYDAAIQWADKGLAIHPEDTELMRHKAMAYACKGDLDTASKVISEAVNIGNNDLVYAVSLVIENELGNTENVEAIKEIYKNAEVEIPERVQSCLDGKMTAKEVFTEGTGDV